MNFSTPTFYDAPADGEAPDNTETVITHWCWAQIDRGPMEKPLVIVRAHELPILRAIHGEPTVRRIGDGPEAVDFHEIDAHAEYARLAQFYGMDGETKRPFVELVYGRYDEGRFVREIEALVQPPKPRKRVVRSEPLEPVADTLGAA